MYIVVLHYWVASMSDGQVGVYAFDASSEQDALKQAYDAAQISRPWSSEEERDGESGQIYERMVAPAHEAKGLLWHNRF